MTRCETCGTKLDVGMPHLTVTLYDGTDTVTDEIPFCDGPCLYVYFDKRVGRSTK